MRDHTGILYAAVMGPSRADDVGLVELVGFGGSEAVLYNWLTKPNETYDILVHADGPGRDFLRDVASEFGCSTIECESGPVTVFDIEALARARLYEESTVWLGTVDNFNRGNCRLTKPLKELTGEAVAMGSLEHVHEHMRSIRRSYQRAFYLRKS
jgi:hypothetical protein